jgi:hypothetical protein
MAMNPFEAMQNLIRDQRAAVQAMKEAAEALTVAAQLQQTSANSPTVGAPVGGGPNGGRARMNDNQTGRPVHGDHASYGRGVHGIRSAVADQIHNRYGSGSGSTFSHAIGPDGQSTGYWEHKEDGTRVLREHGEAGLEDEVKRAGTRSMVSNLATRFSHGGAMGAAKAIPYVGAAAVALEAGHEVLTQVGQERQKNSQYQSIYGGSNFGTGYSNRLQQTGFRMSQLFSGGLTGGQADEAFKGVSSLGFQGSQRSSDLNFISSNYKSMGMGVAESLKLIETASKSLNKELVGLKSGLNDVSDVAKMTGQNAGQARAAFSQNYAAISSVTPGVGASGISSALASMTTGMGRSMQGIDFSTAFTSDAGRIQLANVSRGANGQTLTPTQFSGEMQAGSDVPLKAFDTRLAQIFAPFLTEQVKAFIKSEVDKVGGTDAVKTNPDLAGQVAIKLSQSGLVNSASLRAAVAALSVSVTEAQAVTLLVQESLGVIGNTIQNRADLKKSVQQDLSKAKVNVGAGGGSAGRGNSANAINGPAGQDTTKGVNPVVDMARSTFKGKNVIVNTGSGQRVVSMEIAAKQYTDQVAEGTAVLADTGQSIKDSLGGLSEDNYSGTNTDSNKVGAAGTKSSSLNTGGGESIDAYNKQKQKDNSKKGGTVTITPSPELLKLLNFSSEGNVTIANTGAATGTVPVPGSTTR